jgi:hypothetical protein
MDLIFRSFGRKNTEIKNRSFGRTKKISVQNPEFSGKIFELETSVKVVFRNASVAETRNFELLCN